MHVLINYAYSTLGNEKVFEVKKVSALHPLQLLDNGVELPKIIQWQLIVKTQISILL